MRTTRIRAGSTGSTRLPGVATVGSSLTGVSGESVMDLFTMATNNDVIGSLASGDKSLAMAPVGS